MNRFFQVVLRTTDVEAAHAFYRSVLGEGGCQIVKLHERAVARGAPPHWLGFLQVADVAAASDEFARRGAMSLGPKWIDAEGLEASVMRDPGGAVVALAKPPAGGSAEARTRAARSGVDVAWYALNTADVERAKANYGAMFGWEFKAPLDLGRHGRFHPFTWQSGAAPVGGFIDIAGRAGVHPHWLFHFRVPSLDPALARVRAAGGLVIGPITLPSGARVAVCDDPQGAAFALCVGG